MFTMAPANKEDEPTPKRSRDDQDSKPAADVEQAEPEGPSNAETPSETPDNNGDDAAAKARQRQERFKALQARAVCTHLVHMSVGLN